MATFYLYNETTEPVANMKLKHQVGTTEVIPVDFGSPNGVIELNTDKYFTHFKANVFEGRNIVYRVDKFESVNKDVVRVAYSLDYIKTYFLTHTITDLKGMVERSTNSTNWKKYKDDVCVYGEGYTYGRYNLYPNINYKVLVTLTTTGSPEHYVFAPNDFKDFARKLALTGEMNEYAKYQKQVMSQITKMCYIPDCLIDSGTAVSSLTFPLVPESEDEGLISGTYNVTCTRLNSETSETGTKALNTIPIDNNVNDFTDLNGTFVLTVPYYGMVTLNKAEMVFLKAAEGVHLEYLVDLSGGNVTFRFTASGGNTSYHSFVSLPTVPFSSRNIEDVRYTAAQQAIETRQFSNSTLMGMTAGGVAGAKAGMALGSVVPGLGTAIGGVGGALVGMGASLSLAKINNDNMLDKQANQMAHTLAGIGTENVISAGSSSLCVTAVILEVVKPTLLVSLTDYYNIIGYPVDLPISSATFVDGACYWLNINANFVKEAPEIAAGFIQAISNGIIYNA